MPTLLDKSLVFLLPLATSSAAAEQSPQKLRPTLKDSVRQYLERGLALEKVGLHKEAEQSTSRLYPWRAIVRADYVRAPTCARRTAERRIRQGGQLSDNRISSFYVFYRFR